MLKAPGLTTGPHPMIGEFFGTQAFKAPIIGWNWDLCVKTWPWTAFLTSGSW